MFGYQKKLIATALLVANIMIIDGLPKKFQPKERNTMILTTRKSDIEPSLLGSMINSDPWKMATRGCKTLGSKRYKRERVIQASSQHVESSSAPVTVHRTTVKPSLQNRIGKSKKLELPNSHTFGSSSNGFQHQEINRSTYPNAAIYGVLEASNVDHGFQWSRLSQHATHDHHSTPFGASTANSQMLTQSLSSKEYMLMEPFRHKANTAINADWFISEEPLITPLALQMHSRPNHEMQGSAIFHPIGQKNSGTMSSTLQSVKDTAP